ncbi:MAG: lysine 2,3-aminomutase [Acidobacteria bacterium]|nr:lysine 2,3-aminomutase [Acidobacteriota bacterium]
MAVVPIHSPIAHSATPVKLKIYTRRDIDRIPELQGLTHEQRHLMKAVSAVLPFRVNDYVLENLIDWSNIPDDPMFQLTFPQPGMLQDGHLERMLDLVKRNVSHGEIQAAAREIQSGLNPHPAGQLELNVPTLDARPLEGMQHKYRETVLFFPAAGQTCHAYCTYCFRWAQFVGIDELRFAARQADALFRYVQEHPEVRSVLFTGGDPLVMKTKVLRKYIERLLDPSLEHLESIRIGTKAPAYWPHRFVADEDSDDLLRLFDEVVESGRNLALMAHFSHPRELETPVAREAIRRVRSAGGVVRCQAPLIAHVNDSADVWAEMWRSQVRLGAVPYYMFVERDTGAREYFAVSLARALDVFNGAYRQVSGLERTVRGPSMSATPGKVLVDGVAEVHGEKVFALKFLQGRDPAWAGQVFFARYDPHASWLDHLKPAFGQDEFFFEEELRAIRARHRRQLD